MDEYTGETSQICGGGSRLWQDQYGFTAVQEWIVKIMEKSDFDPTKKGTWPEDCVPVMLYQIADTLRAYERIMSLPVCNTCWKARSCRYCPKPGETVRINCPLYSPSPHDLEKFKKMIDEPEEKTMINLFGEEYIEPKLKPRDKKRDAWNKRFQRWSNEKSQDGTTPFGSCGYGYICDWCDDSAKGNPCVRALNTMLRETHRSIDYEAACFADVFMGRIPEATAESEKGGRQ